MFRSWDPELQRSQEKQKHRENRKREGGAWTSWRNGRTTTLTSINFRDSVWLKEGFLHQQKLIFCLQTTLSQNHQSEIWGGISTNFHWWIIWFRFETWEGLWVSVLSAHCSCTRENPNRTFNLENVRKISLLYQEKYFCLLSNITEQEMFPFLKFLGGNVWILDDGKAFILCSDCEEMFSSVWVEELQTLWSAGVCSVDCRNSRPRSLQSSYQVEIWTALKSSEVDPSYNSSLKSPPPPPPPPDIFHSLSSSFQGLSQTDGLPSAAPIWLNGRSAILFSVLQFIRRPSEFITLQSWGSGGGVYCFSSATSLCHQTARRCASITVAVIQTLFAACNRIYTSAVNINGIFVNNDVSLWSPSGLI